MANIGSLDFLSSKFKVMSIVPPAPETPHFSTARADGKDRKGQALACLACGHSRRASSEPATKESTQSPPIVCARKSCPDGAIPHFNKPARRRQRPDVERHFWGPGGEVEPTTTESCIHNDLSTMPHKPHESKNLFRHCKAYGPSSRPAAYGRHSRGGGPRRRLRPRESRVPRCGPEPGP